MNLFLQKIFSLSFLILSTPLLALLFVLVKLNSPGPFIFKQKRAGRGKKPFTMYKIRTMVDNAERLKSNYLKLNEADGPVFKIRNDPRHTRVGRILARLALDELPQFINIIKGDMALVGPRPLPISEANKIPKEYEARFKVLPGMTSSWVVKGAHKLKFNQWMNLDLEYANKKSWILDIQILILTLFLILKLLKPKP